MKHKFQNPHLKALAKRLVALDTEQSARSSADEHCVAPDYTHRKYRTIADRASDYGVVFSKEALASLNDTAMKESARLSKPVGEDADGANVYHPKVLGAVFAPLLASERV